MIDSNHVVKTRRKRYYGAGPWRPRRRACGMASRSSLLVVASVTGGVLVGCTQLADLVGGGSRTPGLSMVSGDKQHGTAGRALPAPLVVQVGDASGRAFAGAVIRWQVTSGNGSVPLESKTDTRGLSSVIWTLGFEGLNQTVRASIESGPSSLFDVNFGAGADGAATTVTVVAGDGQVAIVGDTLPVPLRVRTVTAPGPGGARIGVFLTTVAGAVF